MRTGTGPTRMCLRCDHLWRAYKDGEASKCPSCKSKYWNTPKESAVRRERPTRRKDPTAKCFFCKIYLSSRFGAKHGTKYCDDCRKSIQVRRYLNARYSRNHYYQRKGKKIKPFFPTFV